LLDGGDLGREQVVQELGVAGLGLLCGFQGRGELVSDRAQPQGVQMLSGLLIDVDSHQHATVASSA
jgi:hypothetical protein